jgi:hypothetical protein
VISEIHIALIFAAALIVGSLIYRKTRKPKWPEMIYQRRSHWKPTQYGENGGGKAWVEGFEVENQALIFDGLFNLAATQRRVQARWIADPQSPYDPGDRTEQQVCDDLFAFRGKARAWVNKNHHRVPRP